MLLIEVPDEERRAPARGPAGVREEPGHIYHVEFDPPKHEGVCDQDGSRLIQRDDDREETIASRLEVYHAQTEPLIAYYDRAGLLRRFDGTRSAEEVHAHIRATLATLRLEESCERTLSSVIIRSPPRRSRRWPRAGRDPRGDAAPARAARSAPASARPSSTRSPSGSSARRAAIPTFKGYRGFPASICASPNSMVVHGIPGPYALARGDVISSTSA